HHAESPSMTPTVARAHRFTVVLNHYDVKPFSQARHHLEIIRIAQQIDHHQSSGPVSNGIGQRIKIIVQCLTINVYELQPQAVLMQWIVGSAPRYRWYDHLVARFE